MELTKDTIILFLVLMPGFVASTVLNTLIVRKSPEGLTLIIEALVFSFIIYVLWALLSGELLFTVGVSEGVIPGTISRKSLGGVLTLSFLLPLVLGALLTHKYLFQGLVNL